jgi:ubiquinone/menaquinone biosynthesis C-methylase UbiE
MEFKMTNLAIKEVITTPDYDAIKAKQQLTWGSGDYGRIGITLQITGELLCESMRLKAGETVLDVAAGNGNVTLAAARRFCKVISTDYVTSLLDQSERRAQAEGLAIEYQTTDAENLPFNENQFDNVVSTFGVMFTPNQKQSASELFRVCKVGGKIGLANWTPPGFIGQLFKTIGQYVAPPAGLVSPALRGTEEFLNQNFSSATSIETKVKNFNFCYQSPQHWLDLFKNYYGPVLKVYENLDHSSADKLTADIHNLIQKHNLANDGSMMVPSEYLEIIITK